MNRHLGLGVVAVVVAGALAWACSDDSTSNSSSGGSSGSSGSSGSTTAKAKATITGTSAASTVQGTAEFVENGSETTVTISITSGGGTPGEHGLHIHDKGNCDAVDGGPGLGAGGHWNPADAGHGYPTATAHHLGDLGNITIDAQGKGTLTVKSKDFYVHDGPLSVVGHAVVFHEKQDDGVSQPVGNAGGRPGCGVIQKE